MMSDEPRRLTLVVPELFGPVSIRQSPAAWQGLVLPGLEGLLSRSRCERLGGAGLERSLFSLFDVDVPVEVDVPVAAVTRQRDAGDAGEYWWLRADPVHLRVDRDRLVMMGNTALNIAEEECAQLVADLNQHFGDEDWTLEAVNARRWYLRLAHDPCIHTEALPEVVGQDILPHMPRGTAEGRWRSLLNEVQMVLHASAVNREREARGLLPVNSLWFWGGGRLPQVPRGGWSQVWGSDTLTAGLASLGGAAYATLPEDAVVWLQDDTPGHHLVVLEGLREKVRFGNLEGWREIIESLHDYWLTPLFAALKQRRLAALSIYPADGTVFHVTAGDARRWWTRRRPLATWLGV